MLRGGVRLFCGILAVCSAARAQGVLPAPTAEAAGVAAEQHPIKVGDVILVPRELLTEVQATETKIEATPTRNGPRRWYGLPILATDGVAYGMFAAAALEEPTSGVTWPIGVASFVLGGPIVHLTRGQWGHAGLSFLMRGGLPVAGALLGASGCVDGGGGCGQGVIGLAVVGMVAATVIDVAALSYEPVPVPVPTPTIQPAVSIGAQHAWVGASGTF